MSADPGMITFLKESLFAPQIHIFFLKMKHRESTLLHHRTIWQHKSSEGVSVQMMDKSMLCSQMISTEESKITATKGKLNKVKSLRRLAWHDLKNEL